MKKVFYILLVVMSITSCVKENPKPNEDKPIITYPNVTDTSTNSIPSLKGTSWVLIGVRIGELGTPITVSDTLEFTSNTSYKYNGRVSKYSLYYTGGGYNFTINGTPWGNLSGTLIECNIVDGFIMGIKFIDITPGSTNDTKYYLWMNRF